MSQPHTGKPNYTLVKNTSSRMSIENVVFEESRNTGTQPIMCINKINCKMLSLETKNTGKERKSETPSYKSVHIQQCRLRCCIRPQAPA